ncbi:unnamed protein product [Oncorhynchus mykiss]|uniref:Uncharacterized protein n=1 Tax=Oncorhynchus mykiss TaxID=8022 RepID=A0A060YND8_ONCMY|nr:unnamed protein product [Oncorhynchus mykiss]
MSQEGQKDHQGHQPPEPLPFHTATIQKASEGDSSDLEIEDCVDGVKSWLSKNKGSTKNLSDDGSLKSSRSVWHIFTTKVLSSPLRSCLHH